MTKPFLPLLFSHRYPAPPRRPGSLTVGEAAARLQSLGFHASTSLIRKLERENLVRIPQRTEGNYRIIDEDTFARIRLVLGLRALGLPLVSIRKILPGLYRARDVPHPRREEVFERLDELITTNVRQLKDLQTVLRDFRR